MTVINRSRSAHKLQGKMTRKRGRNEKDTGSEARWAAELLMNSYADHVASFPCFQEMMSCLILKFT